MAKGRERSDDAWQSPMNCGYGGEGTTHTFFTESIWSYTALFERVGALTSIINDLHSARPAPYAPHGSPLPRFCCMGFRETLEQILLYLAAVPRTMCIHEAERIERRRVTALDSGAHQRTRREAVVEESSSTRL